MCDGVFIFPFYHSYLYIQSTISTITILLYCPIFFSKMEGKADICLKSEVLLLEEVKILKMHIEALKKENRLLKQERDFDSSMAKVYKEIEANKVLLNEPTRFSNPTAYKSTKQFLDEYYAFAERITDDKKLMFEGLQKFLDGGPLMTYKTFRADYPNTFDFNAIREVLQKQYRALSLAEFGRKSYCRKQKEGESFRDYANDIKLLMAIENMPSHLRTHLLISNMRPVLRDALHTKDPKSMVEAEEFAIEMEVTLNGVRDRCKKIDVSLNMEGDIKSRENSSIERNDSECIQDDYCSNNSTLHSADIFSGTPGSGRERSYDTNMSSIPSPSHFYKERGPNPSMRKCTACDWNRFQYSKSVSPGYVIFYSVVFLYPMYHY